MIITLLQFIVATLIWMIMNVAVYFIVDVYELPQKSKVFDFQPFNCRTCGTFWSNIILNVILSITTSFNYPTFTFFYLILTVLTAIAMYVDQKKRTIEV